VTLVATKEDLWAVREMWMHPQVLPSLTGPVEKKVLEECHPSQWVSVDHSKDPLWDVRDWNPWEDQ
jgi:hypothetical protein